MTERGIYCELHAHTCFSLGDAVPQPEELVDRAAGLGLAAVAITDHDNLCGVVPFVLQAEKRGIHAIIGCEFTPEDNSHLTLLAENDAGYSSLCQLISIGQASAPKGSSSLPWSAFEDHATGLICLTGCRQGALAQHLLAHDWKGARSTLNRLTAIFGRANVYVELQRRLRFGDTRLSRRLAALAEEQGLPYVATGNIHYLTRDDADVRAVLLSAKQRIPIPEATSPKQANYEYYLRSPAQMQALFADLPGAIERTVEIAGRCQASLPRGLQLPKYPTPDGMATTEYLRQICYEQLRRLYPERLPEASERLDKELAIIGRLGLADYFLIYWDIGQFCWREDILFHVRGSGAGSIVTKSLGLTSSDPLAAGIVVERFISIERGGVPDLDMDIDHKKRERVIQYAFERFGRDHAAMTATFITHKAKSSRRDVEFALALPRGTLAQASETKESGQAIPERWQQALDLAERLRGRTQYLGQHNGGVILTDRPIAAILPIEPAAMKGRRVAQVDKEWLEELGKPKLDFLGSRTITACADARDAIYQRTGRKINFHRFTYDDPKVYDLICSCRTVGMFQVGSGAEIRIIPAMQPRTIEDLAKQISLVRPGPVVAAMLKPYLARRRGKQFTIHPLLKRALADTLGVIIFQDQVLEIVHDVAGFSYGHAELVRKALGKKDARRAIEAFHAEFLAGALAGGVDPSVAENIWQMIASFANYSFCKPHADAYARIVYWTAWLRLYYPVEFWYGLLRNVPLGTYPARVLEAEARRTGTRFLPFDINLSHSRPTLERGPIRHGLGFVRGIGEEKANAIVEARGDKPFTSLVEVIARTKLPRRALEALILAGALDRLGDRRQLLWDLAEALDIAQRPPQLPLTIPDEHVLMQPFTADEKTFTTFTETGVTVDRHISELKRDAFDQAQCLRPWQLQRTPIGATVRIGGIMADGVRTPPTAKGAGFMRLERLEGFVDVILPAALFADRTSRKALRYAFLVIEGTLQQRGAVISVVAHTVCPLNRFSDRNRKETNQAHTRVQALKIEAGMTRI